MRALLIRERASAAVCGQLTCRGGSRGVVKSNDICPARLRRVRPLRSEGGRNPVEGGILAMPAALGGRGTASWATLALRVGSKMCHLIVLNPVRADAHARCLLALSNLLLSRLTHLALVLWARRRWLADGRNG